MELKLDFKQFMLQESDAQKAKENNDLKSKDASHGNKADKLDPSINEEADTQKDKENDDNKKRDASHGDKVDVLDPSINEKKEVLHGDCDDDDENGEELDESLNFNVDSNIGKTWGQKLDGVNGVALKTIEKGSYMVAIKDKAAIVVKDNAGNEIRLDQSALDQIMQLKKSK